MRCGTVARREYFTRDDECRCVGPEVLEEVRYSVQHGVASAGVSVFGGGVIGYECVVCPAGDDEDDSQGGEARILYVLSTPLQQ